MIMSSSSPPVAAGDPDPQFHGVRKLSANIWVCEVRHPQTRRKIRFGSHPTAEMAARAFDVVEIAFRGECALLNFADSWARLPIPASADVDDIRKAAAEAAEAFRPKVKLVPTSSGSIELLSASGSCVGYMGDADFGSPELEFDEMALGMVMAPPRWYELDSEVDTQMTSLWSFPV